LCRGCLHAHPRMAKSAIDRSSAKNSCAASLRFDCYGTPLEFLLEELKSRELIIMGVAADSCVAITAHDAHVRKFKLWVPSDCVASEKPEYKRNALAHLRSVAEASTKASTSR
jgi:nicotinamidase-related amidase